MSAQGNRGATAAGVLVTGIGAGPDLSGPVLVIYDALAGAGHCS
jgi:hypothetical protein